MLSLFHCTIQGRVRAFERHLDISKYVPGNSHQLVESQDFDPMQVAIEPAQRFSLVLVPITPNNDLGVTGLPLRRK
jgi:hypothetical protein